MSGDMLMQSLTNRITLCEQNGVRFVQAEEPEIYGMWDWLDDNGNACDQSFNSLAEAVNDAIERLGINVP